MSELLLFWTFFKIGLFTIGGGQAMIPMITKDLVEMGAVSLEEVMDFIAIAESTPGPFAVNIATYVGMKTTGILGAIAATAGVVLPSVIIIIIVAKLLTAFMKKRAVGEVFSGVRSTVTGLLLSVLCTLMLSVLLGVNDIFAVTSLSLDWIGIAMFAAVCPLSFLKIKGKKLNPIFFIVICAALGVLCYGLCDYFGVAI